MISKILNSKRKWSSLILSGIGSVIGLSLLLISLQIYFDIQNLISDDSGALNKDYLVIKKEISDIDMIKGSSSSFNKKEISELMETSFVDSLATFKSCQFYGKTLLSAPLSGKRGPKYP